MTIPDPQLFSDVADALGIANPIIVEKDFYAVLLLKTLAKLDSEHYELVFAGGTCLAKVHRNTYRMSEDIDSYIAANLANAYILSRWKVLLKGRYFWLRSLGASTCSEALYSLIAINHILH